MLINDVEEGGETGEFDTEAYMWSGHGDNKSYCTQYIQEFERYKEFPEFFLYQEVKCRMIKGKT